MNKMQSEFFDRQIKLDNIGVIGQEKLLAAKVLVIGAGGLGCSVLESITRSGIGFITIIDFDLVEASNLHRQVLFNYEDIGESKSEVAKNKICKIAPWLEVIALTEQFGAVNSVTLLTGHDIVIDCTDNLRIKFEIHDACFLNKINLIQSSIHKFDGQLQVFRFSEHQDKGCLRCLWDDEPEQISSCNDNGVLGLVPAFFGVLQANEAIKMILGIDSQIQNEVVTFNLLNLEFNKLKYKKNTDCKFCVRHEEENMEYFEKDANQINFNDYTWLDIRIATAQEKLPDSIPMDQFLTKSDKEIMGEIPDYPQDKPFLVLCDKGFRAAGLTKMLREFGTENVFSLIGGYSAIKDM